MEHIKVTQRWTQIREAVAMGWMTTYDIGSPLLRRLSGMEESIAPHRMINYELALRSGHHPGA